VKPYSPPHRPSIVDQTDHDMEPSSSRPGVDEFGREIRPSSDDEASETPDDPKQRPTPPQSLPTHLPPTSAPAVEGAPVPGEHASSASAAPQAAPTASGSNALHQDRETPGLESFDYAAFDPTSPASWEALGRAWAVTNGRQPSQEELMMFAMEVTVNMANQAPASGPGLGMQGNQRQGSWMGDFRGGPPRGGRGRGAFGARGRRGGFAYGNSGGDGQARWDHGGDVYAQETDAIVLGEHTNAQNDSSGWPQGSSAHEQAQVAACLAEEGDRHTESQDPTGGRMQKVGGNWVFTPRNDGPS
jgi:protein NRD1